MKRYLSGRMKRPEQARFGVFLISITAVLLLAADAPEKPKKKSERAARNIVLPAPQQKGKVSLEEALWKRRSVRKFMRQELALAEISQLMWAAQGVNRSEGNRPLRTAPSAGQAYPLEVYLVARDGLFHYLPQLHQLEWLDRRDRREALCEAAAKQEAVREAPAVIVLTAIVERTAAQYGDQAARYIYLEAGHVAQNIQLQTAALNLGSICIAGFFEGKVKEALELPDGEIPVYIIPIGWPDPLQPTPVYGESSQPSGRP